jgi:hypothetical protein
MRQRKHELGLGIRCLCSAAGEIGIGTGAARKGRGVQGLKPVPVSSSPVRVRMMGAWNG